MNIMENLINAFQVIILNKMRAALSMLGIIIGVASVIILISIGQGATQSIVSKVEALGTNLITVTPGTQSSTNVRNTGGSNTNIFKQEQVDAIKNQVPYIADISPEVRSSSQVIYESNNTSTTIYGVTSAYSSVHNFKVNYGSYITNENVKNSDKVAVIGTSVASTLFSGANPIGKDIIIGSRIYTIVGVMEEKGSSGFTNTDDVIFIPLTTAQKELIGNDYIRTISISVANSDKMTDVKNYTTQVLLNSLSLSASDQNFTVSNQADSLSTLSSITSTMTMFLGGIAAISLIVGGIGVMNIMLVSVTERTREIGIRKALGATKFDILGQFLMESLVLSLLGGFIGIAISYIVIFIIQKLNLLSVSLSVNSIFLSCGFSLGIGIVFGILPAYKAGNLKPIDALRFE